VNDTTKKVADDDYKQYLKLKAKFEGKKL